MMLFTPQQAATVNRSVTTSTASVALPTLGLVPDQVLRVKNISLDTPAFITFGTSTVTATTSTGMPIGPNETIGIRRPAAWTHMAAITASGSTTIYVTAGDGV